MPAAIPLTLHAPFQAASPSPPLPLLPPPSSGCQCLDLSQGQFCEVPPSCPSGIMDSAVACCPSGVLDRDGGCCPQGGPDPALDAAGRCCPDSSKLDACGVCGGTAQAIDMAVSGREHNGGVWGGGREDGQYI